MNQYKDTLNMYLLGRIDTLIIYMTLIDKIKRNLNSYYVKNVSSTKSKPLSKMHKYEILHVNTKLFFLDCFINFTMSSNEPKILTLNTERKI